MALSTVVETFEAAGGRFVTPANELATKLDRCRAIVFDWDGVFNDGRKGKGSPSGFSEADSMGTNMLRYGLWRKLGTLPYTAIISGENNDTAVEFAKREHFTAAYTGMRKKQEVIAHLCNEHGLEADEIACVFDDINDLPMAGLCGLRLMVRRDSSPLFAELTSQRNLCDYLTGADANGHPVREACELLLGVLDAYSDTVDSRVAFDDQYQEFFAARQSVETSCFFLRDGVISKL